MIKIIILCSVLFFNLKTWALTLPSEFKCTQTVYANVCTVSSINTKNFKYPLPVSVIIPLEIINNGISDFILYVHGFRGVCTTSNGTPDSQISPLQFVQNFALDKSLAQAVNTTHAPSVMIVPMSSGKNYEHNNYLVPKLKEFMNWFEGVAGVSKNTRWRVSGHSGAGSVISRALNQNKSMVTKTDGIILLDATYSMANHIDEWENIAKANHNVSIFSVYLKTSSTASGSLMLRDVLNQLKVGNKPLLQHPVSVEGVSTAHCKLPNLYLQKYLEK